MKHRLHYILYIFLFSFLTSLAAWGQGETVTIDLSLTENEGGYRIKESNKTYIFTGEYKGKPTETAKGAYKGVIIINHEITATIILQNVTIKLNSAEMSIPLYFAEANNVTLLLEGKNVLSGGIDNAAICAPQKGKLIINNNDPNKEGILEVTGGLYAPGIGTFFQRPYKEISIEGGIITANAGSDPSEGCPGIGAGPSCRDGGTIRISGGTVTATGSGKAPGIGKSVKVKGGSIAITGGIVKATGGEDGMGIGSYNYAPDESSSIPADDYYNITISGGSVTAINGANYSGPSIAGGKDKTFSTGSDGNAFIVSNGIGDQSGRDNWQGVIIEKDKGAVYGTSVTLSTDADIPAGVTLTNEKELIIRNGVTLKNKGTIQNNNILKNNGEILNDKEITGSILINPPKHAVTCNFNYPESPEAEIRYVTETGLPADPASSRTYYTFNAWFDKASEGAEVTSITKPATVYAYWSSNPISIVSAPSTLTGETNHAITNYKLSELISGSDDSGSKTYEWASSTDDHYGLSLSNGIISGVPTKSTLPGATLSVLIKAENGATANVDIPISITLPTFYTLTLPANPVGYSLLKPDGSPFSPSDLQVEEGADFTFKLQLEPDYSESTPTVEADGVSGALTADPDGVYTIPVIQANTEIRVSGVIRNTPPPPPPVYEPVYYTVTLPAVEGAVTDPIAGSYEKEAWDTFIFYLTLDTAYSQSVPVVTTSRYETIRPRTSDGAYLVKYVRSDVEIFIDGIVKNNPVANETIRPDASVEPQIWAEGTRLCIRMPNDTPPAPVRILTFDGRLIYNFRSAPGLNARQLPTGLYIVKVGDTVRKVAVNR